MSPPLEILLAEARLSDCAKLQFGAAALNAAGEILALGHNHNPLPTLGYSCATHCAGGIRQGVKSGTRVELCYAIHAEQHALLGAGGSAYEIAVAGLLPGNLLFDNGGGFYCTVCARLMAAGGVEFVTVFSKACPVRLTIAEAVSQSYRLATA